MIGWIVAGSILLLVLVLLLMPVALWVEYDDVRQRYFWKISWFWLPLLRSTGDGLLQRFRKKPSQKQPKPQEKSKTQPAPDTRGRLRRGWDLFQSVARRVPKALRLFWKGISIRKLTIGVQVGKFDAKACAIAYGAYSSAVYTALGVLQSMLRVSVEQVQVRCAFGTEGTVWVIRGKLRVCPLAAISALCSVLLGMIWDRVQRREAEELQ